MGGIDWNYKTEKRIFNRFSMKQKTKLNGN
jgi:hypothetical protein